MKTPTVRFVLLLVAGGSIFAQNVPPPNGQGQALGFDGVDDYLSASPAGLPVGNSPYTIEAWIKTTAMNTGTIAAWGSFGSPNQVNGFRLTPTGLVNYWWANDLNVSVNLVGAWHHVAATFDGTTRRILVDGVVAGSDTPVGHNATSSGFRIGSASAGEFFSGQMDEVRIWDVGRTAVQIQEAMRRQVFGNESGLVACYRFDEGRGLSVFDATGNTVNTATLVNGPVWVASSIVPFAPTVFTELATPITGTSATLNGLADARASWTSLEFYFQWGPGLAMTNTTFPFIAGAGAAPVYWSSPVAGLVPGTTYSFRAVAMNDLGSSYGVTQSFVAQSPQTFTVFNNNPSGPGSLRRAILDANAAPGRDTITFAVTGTIALNSQEVGADSLYVTDDVSILGPGASLLTVEGGDDIRFFRILHITNASVTIAGLTFARGVSFGSLSSEPGLGGALLNHGTLLLSNCVLRGNSARGALESGQPALGGAVYNDGNLTVVNCTLRENIALGGEGQPGHAPNFIPGLGATGLGGAIYNEGMLLVRNSTFAGNVAQGGMGGTDVTFDGAGGNGGDSYGGALYSSGPAILINCTVASNAAHGGGGGPGAIAGASGVGGAGGVYRVSGMCQFLNTLVALNTANVAFNVFGQVASLGHNLIGVTNNSSGWLGSDLKGSAAVPLNPLLGALASHGGFTETLFLLDGSPALDAGDNSVTTAPYLLATDQRGRPRWQGATVDIGAFERDLGRLFIVTNTLDGLVPGSLRTAISNANANVGPDTILFGIPAPGLQTIAPLSPLPTITSPVIIDGYSQPGASPNTQAFEDDAVLLIELAGDHVNTNFSGLRILTNFCTIRGLVVNGFQGSGILVNGGHSNVIVGNFIGTDRSGLATRTNRVAGITVFNGTFNRVGGTDPADRNLVSEGLSLGGTSGFNTALGNFFGIGANGSTVIGGFSGIFSGGTTGRNLFGGTLPGAGNVISGHRWEGIHLQSDQDVVQGNRIGVTARGDCCVSNRTWGISIVGSGNLVGGSTPQARNIINGSSVGVAISGPISGSNNRVEGNVIAGNFVGVAVFSGTPTPTNNAILGNSISNNVGLGIDLGFDGIAFGLGVITENDAAPDADAGPNNFQNFPLLTNVVSDGAVVTVRGTLSSAPNQTYRIDLFRNQALDPSGCGEGEVYLGGGLITTDGGGLASFTLSESSPGLGGYVTATATDPAGNTSEFSLARPVQDASALPPVNDPFAGAIVLTGTEGTVRGNNLNATREAGEPPSEGGTIWWRWTAPDQGAYFFDSFGDSFDTELTIYAGTDLVQLQLVSLNDPFIASDGVTYSIRVDGKAGARGDITLRWGLMIEHLAEVKLNSLIYHPNDPVRVEVRGIQSGTPASVLRVMVAAGSNDVELLPLHPTAELGVYETQVPLMVQEAAAPGTFVRGDGQLTLLPREVFVAMFTPYDGSPAGAAQLYASPVSADFGILADPHPTNAAVSVRPEIALTDDERAVPPGGKAIGTLLPLQGLPVQIALNELIFYPRDLRQLQQFLQETGGDVIADDRLPWETGPARSYLIHLPTDGVDPNSYAQLREFLGDTNTLLVSSAATTRILACQLQGQLNGYAVGLNPRLQYLGAPSVLDDGGFMDAMMGDFLGLDNPFVGLPNAWAYLALWDADNARIPVAVLDGGFAPNWDFRGYNPSLPDLGLFQRDIEGGTGSAVAPPSVGASFFGPRVWHGNGVVSTLGGVINNGWGVVGTGGQVAVPRLYKMGLASYAFELGRTIRMAADDGATIINISAGYPCRVRTQGFLPDLRICSAGGRATLCLAVEVAYTSSVLVACSFGFFIDPSSCGRAYDRRTAALAACYGLFLVGDPRGPLEEGVNHALTKGVTVVASAGNALGPETLGLLCELIRCGAQDVSEWEILPAVIDGVICVGAADKFSPYQNLHYFGNRVDVWAPTGHSYRKPPTLDAVTGPDDQNADQIGGTSGSAPYVSGIIAMMQAVAPLLDPRTPYLSASERAAIPRAIRAMLMSTATPAAALPVDPNGLRRNLVNAAAAIQAARPGALRYFDEIGYDRSRGFDEQDASNDVCPPNLMVPAKLTVPAEFNYLGKGTILTIPNFEPPYRGRVFTDQDCFAWQTPSEPGVYVGGRIQLRQPRADHYGLLQINGQPGTLVWRSNTEEVREYSIPPHFNGCREPYTVKAASTAADSDNVYQIQFYAARREALPEPDRFDQPMGNLPHPDNDSPERAVHIGDSRFPWGPPTGGGRNADLTEVTLADLNFHRGCQSPDVDWFRIQPPPIDLSQCRCDSPQLRIHAAPGVLIEVYDRDLNLLRSGQLLVLLFCRSYEGRLPLFVALRSATAGPASYNLKVTWTLGRLDIDPCGYRELKPPPLHSLIWPDLINPLGPDPVDPRDFLADPAGRILEPRTFLVEWPVPGPFRAQVRVPQGASVQVQFLNSQGTLLAQNATADLFMTGGGLAQTAAAEQPPPALSSEGTVIVEIDHPNLAEGAYVLAISHAQFGTPVEVLLPRNALPEGATSLEDRLALGFVPGDLDGDGFLTQADLLLAEGFVTGAQTPTADQVTHGDANGNGHLDEDDLQRLQDELNGTRDLHAEWPVPIFRELLTKAVVTLDADGDGMPDFWEFSHGLNPADGSDGPADHDQDGFSNEAEYKAGTDPRDPQSFLRIDSIQATTNLVELRFKALGEKSYTVQYRASLDSGFWQRLTDVEAAFYTRSVAVTDPVGEGRGQRFYRLVATGGPFPESFR